MKTIKVFIASSYELRLERLELGELVHLANKILKSRQIKIELAKWEYLDSSMGSLHKQEEYNNELKSCEIVIVLFWKKLGEYTKKELDIAYEELCAGRNPQKLYVFFKNMKKIMSESKELQELQDNFGECYGHFYNSFDHVDTMRLEFLLQLEIYLLQTHPSNISESLLKVENSKVMMGNIAIADFNNVPFASMNKEFQRLNKEISELDEEIKGIKHQETLKELNQYQDFLFGMARTTAKLSTERITKRMAEAIKLFNQGNAVGANAALVSDEMVDDAENNKKDYIEHSDSAKQCRAGLEDSIKEFRLKADTVLVDNTIAIESRIEQAKQAYETAIEYAKVLEPHINDQDQYADLLFDYEKFSVKHDFYNSQGVSAETLKYHSKALEVQKSVSRENDHDVTVNTSDIESIGVKTIKVFLASSDELRRASLEFTDLVHQLNRFFKSRQTEIELDKLEYLDSSMGPLHKQNEYKNVLENCKVTLVLYWKKLGDYTKIELDIAYKELCEGRNPQKLYVFFRNTNIANPITPELQDFRDSFPTEYGHFHCRFENIDTMRAKFLLQFESYLNENLSEPWLRVENSTVFIGNDPAVNLNNVPFASMNKEFQKLNKEISELDEEIGEIRENLLTDPDNEKTKNRLSKKLTKRREALEELDQHQNFLLDLARTTAKLSTERITKCMEEARKLFDQGDAVGANALLDTDMMINDAENNAKGYIEYSNLAKQHRANLEDSVKEFRLKVNTVLADNTIAIESRIEQAKQAYEKAIEYAKVLDYHINNQEQYADLLSDYARFSEKYASYDMGELLFLELIDIYVNLNSTTDNAYDTKLAPCYSNIGSIYSHQEKHDKALECYSKALEIQESIFGENDPGIAVIYNNIGYTLESKEAYDKALEAHDKAHKIFKSVFGENDLGVAISCNNIGSIYCRQEDYDKALGYYLEAHKIFKSKLGDDDLSTAKTYGNIGVVFNYKGNYTRALVYHLKACKIFEYVLGENHPSTAKSYSNIGFAYDSKGHYDKALEYYLKAHEIFESVGKNHPDVAELCNNIVLVYLRQGNWDKALEYHLKAHEIFESVGKNHPSIASTYNNIGSVYSRHKELR